MTTLVEEIDPFLHAMVRRLAPNTLRAYRTDLTHLAVSLTAPLHAVTLTEIEAAVSQLSATPSTYARRIASANRFFRWAVREGLCAHNPMDAREPTRVIRRLPRPVRSLAERATIDAAIAATVQPYRLIFTILRESGMRIGEVLHLNIGDVTLDPGREGLRVREPKNGVERSVILGPTSTPRSLRGLRAWMRELKGQPTHAPVFRSNRGTRLSYEAAKYQWTKLCESVAFVNDDGTPRYTLHQLRHTRGTELVEEGQPMEIIQRALGHRDIRSTQGYADLTDSQVRDALEQDRRAGN